MDRLTAASWRMHAFLASWLRGLAKPSLFLTLWGLLVLPWSAWADSPFERAGLAARVGGLHGPQFVVIDYQPVSKTEVPGSHGARFDYAYRVVVRNFGEAAPNVVGTATSMRGSVSVVEGQATFGAVAARATKTSSDTITLRANRYFDRRLDRRGVFGGRPVYQEPGDDDDDRGVPGLGRHDPAWAQPYIDDWYDLKLGLILSWNIRVVQGNNAPQISAARPTGLLNTTAPTIGASYTDDTAINPANVVLFVDGVNVSTAATITATAISYVPASALAQGVHDVALGVTDAQGLTSNASWSFTVDSVAPTISAMAPKDVTNAPAKPTISAALADTGSGVDVAQVRFLLDGVDLTTAAVIAPTGVSYTPATPLQGGMHTVQVRVADMAGNATQAAWQFAVDASAPVVSGLVPAANAVLPAATPVTIQASYSDNSAGVDPSKVRLRVDGVDVTAQAQVSPTAISLTAASLAEGIHQVVLSVFDANGNGGDTSWSFTTRSEPVIAQVGPKDVVLGVGSTPTIVASYSDVGAGVDRARVRLVLDGVDVTALASVQASALSYAPVGLSQGAHVVVLTVVDLAGNATSASWQFAIDTGLPRIFGESPKSRAIALARPEITAQFQDTGDTQAASGIDAARVRLLLDGVDVTAQARIDAAAVPGTISFLPSSDLASGTHGVKLVVGDRGGNLVESLWDFVVDLTGPSLSVTLPAAADLLQGSAVTIQAEYADLGAGVDSASLQVLLDGANITTAVTPTPGGFSHTPVLAEGSHVLIVRIRDLAGNASEVTKNFIVATPPVISNPTPKDVVLGGGATPTISASYADASSGIDLTKVRLLVDGADVTAQAQVGEGAVTYSVSSPLTDGAHEVQLTVADRLGSRASMTWQFGTAQPPVIGAVAPRDVRLPPGSLPTITASYGDARVGINLRSVQLFFDGEDVTARSVVGPDGVSFTPAGPLAGGAHTAYLVVENNTNSAASAAWGFEVAPPPSYALTFVEPAGPMNVANKRLPVKLAAASNTAAALSLSINGTVLTNPVYDSQDRALFATELTLVEGVNPLLATVTFSDGTRSSAQLEVTYDGPPVVNFISPADKAVLGPLNGGSGNSTNLTGNVERPVQVAGRLSKPAVSVTINQQAAQLQNGGTEFVFPNYFLHEGVNTLTAVATDAAGRSATATITVSVDQTAPILTVEYPRPGTITRQSQIDVRGMVNDAVESAFGAPEPTVTVNGVAAQVADRYFYLPALPLRQGQNTLSVVATDHLGNSRAKTLLVHRGGVDSSGLLLDSGNNQTVPANGEAPAPLVVLALDAQGEPAAGREVTFTVSRGTGSVSPLQGQSATGNAAYRARAVTVTTDAEGRARVWFTVGRSAGPGANAVSVSAPTIAGDDLVFVANATKGVANRISSDFGTNQLAETDARTLEVLSAVIRDANDNYLPNVRVRFRVDSGDGRFVDEPGAPAAADGKSIDVWTDKNGVAAVRPLVGSEPGEIRISASALRQDGGSFDNTADTVVGAQYIIRSRKAQAGPASFAGIIYTDKGQPLPGVRVTIGRTSLTATTDSTGRFRLDDVPPGRADLFIDGRTTRHLDTLWPSLHFEAMVVRGQANELPHPIYLPPLAMGTAKEVGGPADVELTIPGLEGFKMVVKANSVTFPDGSKVGQLVVSPVTGDKLPMSPPAGAAQFGLPAWTVQPAGTRFDPPIEVHMPNGTNERPGDNLPVVQWDHDLGQFVPMGRATVSADGSVLITDAGSGLTKAGWGGLCRYDECRKATPKCTQCEKIENQGNPPCPTCVPDPSKDDVKTKLGVFNGALTRKLPPVPLPLDLSLEVTFEFKGSLDAELACCKGKGGSPKPSGVFQAGGSLEVAATFPVPIPFPGIGLGTTYYIPFGGTVKVGVFGKIAGAGEMGAEGEFNKCEEKICLKGSAGLKFIGEVGPKIEYGNDWLKAPTKDEFNVVVGLEGGQQWIYLVCDGSGERKRFATAYLKAEYSMADRSKFTIFNISKTVEDTVPGDGGFKSSVMDLMVSLIP